jgi:glycosyltransferase involved in cell wall biosynthesis
MPHLLLDLSRLISSAGRPAPTGIDRVELAYARELLSRPEGDVSFAAMSNWRAFGLVTRQQAHNFISALSAQWFGGKGPARASRIADRIGGSVAVRGERALHGRLRRQHQPVIYLNVSHHHLDRPASIERLKKRLNVRFVPLVHDLIPIAFPEYQRPNQAEIHIRRIATVTRLSDAVIVNSQATADLLAPEMVRAAREVPILVSHLGFDLPDELAPTPFGIPRPYFICVGTIEPRKNHLLLLKLWRKLARELGEEAPHLVIVGRRGWEIENVVDMLERCPGLHGKVHEFSEIKDSEVCGLIQGAQALLFPSFSEGFGLPLMEALALGTPVLCSEIPAFLEVGAGAPEFFDPLDGPSWYAAIRDYARPVSPRRDAQLARIKNWTAPIWQRHFQDVDVMLNNLIGN